MSARIENEYFPERVTHPGTTLAEALEERGMTQAQLSERTGRPRKTINEIVKGLTVITPETAIQLERVLGISASFWNNRQRQFDESVARERSNQRLQSHIGWLGNFPISQMVRLGWIEKKESKILQLETLLSFFGIDSPEEWESVCQAPWIETAFRESKAYSTSVYALSAWLRKGEVEAVRRECKPFNKPGFRKALGEIRRIVADTPKGFETAVVQLCASAGVAVAFVPLIKGVHAWGATRWLSPDKAMLILSLRGKLEDVFWFTFFHESAHILLHGKRIPFVEGIKSGSAVEEGQADSFARDFLIPAVAWGRFIASHARFTEENVVAFAREIGMSAAIVAGRLQHEKLIPNSNLNRLRRRIDSRLSA